MRLKGYILNPNMSRRGWSSPTNTYVTIVHTTCTSEENFGMAVEYTAEEEWNWVYEDNVSFDIDTAKIDDRSVKFVYRETDMPGVYFMCLKRINDVSNTLYPVALIFYESSPYFNLVDLYTNSDLYTMSQSRRLLVSGLNINKVVADFFYYRFAEAESAANEWNDVPLP